MLRPFDLLERLLRVETTKWQHSPATSLRVMSGESVARADWSTVVASFRDFFARCGEVVVSPDEIEFTAGFTGLAVRQDGTSKSFMPLHDLEAGWETIIFDHEAGEVRLIGGGATYTYRVPPQLRR